MERHLQEAAGIPPHEIAFLAGKHGTTEDKVRQLMRMSGSRSRRELEEALMLSSRLLTQEAFF